MAKRFTDTVLVTDVSRKCSSIYGNPSYWVTFVPKDSSKLKGYIASNASCGYSASNFVGKLCKICYHYSQKGCIIINTMEEV